MADDSDNVYFKRLLDLVPAQILLTDEDKELIRNSAAGGDKKNKAKGVDPLVRHKTSELQSTLSSLSAKEEKIQGKKNSKQKRKKEKDSSKVGQSVNVKEAQEKLRARITELQAKRANGLTSIEMQEQKRLQRKERRLMARKKQKNKNKNKSEPADNDTPSSPPVLKKSGKPIVNQEGKLVFSKFDFTHSGIGDKEKEKHSALVGKDYKRLLQRLEQREAKVAKVKGNDPAAAAKLEEKFIWQDVLDKAKGDKVKDDPTLLKKAMKRKDKMKDHKKQKWAKREKTVEHLKKEKQDKRQQNIDKRKDDKKAKHRKKLIKKGRILPGF